MAVHPRSYRVLVVEKGAKPGLLARAQADVIVTEQGSARWQVTKNKAIPHSLLLIKGSLARLLGIRP